MSNKFLLLSAKHRRGLTYFLILAIYGFWETFSFMLSYLCPYFYFKVNLQNIFMRGLSWLFNYKLGITFLGLATMVEGILVNPQNGFASYAFTTHGFLLGMICFSWDFALLVPGGYFGRQLKTQGYKPDHCFLPICSSDVYAGILSFW